MGENSRMNDGAAIPYSVIVARSKNGIHYSIENAEKAGKTRSVVALELEAVARDLRMFEPAPGITAAAE